MEPGTGLLDVAIIGGGLAGVDSVQRAQACEPRHMPPLRDHPGLPTTAALPFVLLQTLGAMVLDHGRQIKSVVASWPHQWIARKRADPIDEPRRGGYGCQVDLGLGRLQRQAAFACRQVCQRRLVGGVG